MSEYNKFEVDLFKRTAYNLALIMNPAESLYEKYETTQLINSFIGMLVIPQQKHFKKLMNNNSGKLKYTANVMSGHMPEMLIPPTYEKKLTWEVITHLRSSISHGSFSMATDSESEISGLDFKDYFYQSNEERAKSIPPRESFSCKIDLKDLKKLFFSIGRLLFEGEINETTMSKLETGDLDNLPVIF